MSELPPDTMDDSSSVEHDPMTLTQYALAHCLYLITPLLRALNVERTGEHELASTVLLGTPLLMWDHSIIKLVRNKLWTNQFRALDVIETAISEKMCFEDITHTAHGDVKHPMSSCPTAKRDVYHDDLYQSRYQFASDGISPFVTGDLELNTLPTTTAGLIMLLFNVDDNIVDAVLKRLTERLDNAVLFIEPLSNVPAILWGSFGVYGHRRKNFVDTFTQLISNAVKTDSIAVDTWSINIAPRVSLLSWLLDPRLMAFEERIAAAAFIDFSGVMYACRNNHHGDLDAIVMAIRNSTTGDFDVYTIPEYATALVSLVENLRHHPLDTEEYDIVHVFMRELMRSSCGYQCNDAIVRAVFDTLGPEAFYNKCQLEIVLCIMRKGDLKTVEYVCESIAPCMEADARSFNDTIYVISHVFDPRTGTTLESSAKSMLEMAVRNNSAVCSYVLHEAMRQDPVNTRAQFEKLKHIENDKNIAVFDAFTCTKRA